ncbi:hypothetical protein [Nocardiopsis suaedae]|uniref:Uncharacterized protein n=1 Tax=Nocardiopsis suaedae TaxID=3018444 RepID=A0ABT4TLG2_9ACTN|nr:hypothetical protein [Nocardiopsis suaedae]MDA2805069.1 hypothetical protein [Nocardiopsis suaedae]
MKRRSVALFGVVGVGVLAAGAAAVVVAVHRAEAPDTTTSVTNPRPPGEVSEHWTDERMEQAEPR